MKNKVAKSAAPRPVASAERTLAILDAFIGRQGPVSLREIEEATGLFRSAIFRYMTSFINYGYIKKTLDGRYILSGKVLQLSAAFESEFDLGHVIHPTLKMLSNLTQESALFYVPLGDKRLCLSRSDSPQTVRVSVPVGTSLPIDESATGQVFSKYANATIKHNITGELPICTRNIGYTSSASSASVPIFRAGEIFVGALTISGPASRFDPDNKAVAEALLTAATDLSTTIGSVTAYRGGLDPRASSIRGGHLLLATQPQETPKHKKRQHDN